MHGFRHLFGLDQTAMGALGVEFLPWPVCNKRRHDGAGENGADAKDMGMT